MTRVLFLTESYFPVLGGGERHIQLLATRLTEKGMPACVLTRRTEASWAAEECLEGVRVVRVPPHGSGRAGKYLMLPAVVRELRRRRDEYDLIVVRGTRVLGIPAVVMARSLRKPVVLQPEITGEVSGDVYTWGTRWHGTFAARCVRTAVGWRNLLLRRADQCIPISEAIRREFIAAGFDSHRIALIHHGVDTRRFHPASDSEKNELRRRLGLPPGVELLIFVGRLLKGKGIEVLIEAFEQVARARSQAVLALVGSGDGQSLSIEEKTRSRVAGSSLAQRVLFTGRVDNVEDYLRAGDMFVFPSLFEALPLAVIEAGACGLACVASCTGGIPDVIEDGVDGLLVRPGDTPALVEATQRMLEAPDLRARLGNALREKVVRCFDLQFNVERYQALFSTLFEK
ncbi:MAG: glycosyltransferase family 4 protein [Vicinamibacteria bacterium]|nr:glycosyltransferase family 4 protein [Vicinamibacteria bacterium]